MLIQITNQCNNNCPHCLHNSVINGGQMTLETYEKVLNWIEILKPWAVVITGGEPFTHPKLYEMCSNLRCKFIVTSNGNFILNPFLKRMAIAIGNLPNCMGIQVTSVPTLYPNYWEIRKHVKELNDIPSVNLCLDIDIYIKDLGRARGKYPVNTVYPAASCVNTHLVAKQTHSLQEMIQFFNQVGKYCEPLIDYQGNIHCSESWLCPSYGNLDTPMDIVWQKMKDTPPCGKCANWKAMQNMQKYSRVLQILK